MTDTKPTNPKDIVGSSKIDMGLAPWTLMVCAARALLEGALKYGCFNWRIAGARSSIYLAATKRHIAKYENGQNCDPKTKVHHLDNAIASLAIMRDAELYGKLTDDRPPCPDPDAMARMIDGEAELVAHLREEFKDHNPKQYTIADTPRQAERPCLILGCTEKDGHKGYHKFAPAMAAAPAARPPCIKDPKCVLHYGHGGFCRSAFHPLD